MTTIGLHRDGHARAEDKVTTASLGRYEIGNLRIFVHRPADAMAHKLANHAESGLLKPSTASIAQHPTTCGRLGVIDRDLQGAFGHIEQLPHCGLTCPTANVTAESATHPS